MGLGLGLGLGLDERRVAPLGLGLGLGLDERRVRVRVQVANPGRSEGQVPRAREA